MITSHIRLLFFFKFIRRLRSYSSFQLPNIISSVDENKSFLLKLKNEKINRAGQSVYKISTNGGASGLDPSRERYK